MPRSNSRVMIFGLMCVVPVLLCFIGGGVLLYVAADESSGEVAQRVQDHQTAAQLEEKCRVLHRRIAELEEQLREADRRLEKAKKAEGLQSQVSQLQQERERLQQELEQLRKQWEEIQKRLSTSSHELARLEQEVAKAQAKLAHLQQKIQEMQPGPGEAQDQGPTMAELEAAKQQLTEALQRQNNINEQKQARLDELSQKVKEPGRTLRVDEIRGSGQWQLPPNPLYVECDGQGILLQPEKCRLPTRPTSSQEEEFLRTVRDRKYVLFLVRPNGFDSFRVYRQLLRQKAGGIDYGYEPIRQDGEVLYPERN
ncbi:MAG: hypothetical protein NZ602_07615 [Thermoguttaceae bacterium]|nr:hypothetical protein [Thermoguttaceae bacterium]MDW8038276.1 hypothetical protein [Thermoguttaceae bacterium]